MFQVKDNWWRIKHLLSRDKAFYSSLFRIMGFVPHRLNYYKVAMLHRSLDIHDKESHQALNNERLEYLGDAVLDAVVGDIVFRRYPDKQEGFLTQARSKLVKRATLGKVANDMGLPNLIKSNASSTMHNSYLGGNAFEALVGAIYLDRGYAYCMRFLEHQVLGKYINLDELSYEEVNFKSELIEWGQKNKVNIGFELLNQTKDQTHSPLFQSKVLIENLIAGGVGQGYSKRESQQKAAERTLQRITNDRKYRARIFQVKQQQRQMRQRKPAKEGGVKGNMDKTETKKE